jgi:hypothetical protein
VIGAVIKEKETQCDHETVAMDEYFSGNITDYEMIKQNMSKRVENLRTSETVQYVLDGTFYGDDAISFINALRPNDFERQALKFFLEQAPRSVVVNNATANSVMEFFWKDHGKSFLLSILDDEETIDHLVSLHETPSVIVSTGFQLSKRRLALQHLPTYEGLPAVAQFADTLVRIYRTDGVDKMIAAVVKQRPDSPQGKAMAYAFLQAVGKAKDRNWMFSKVEIETGEFLRPFVERLLNETPEAYHSVFQELFNASGSVTLLDDHKVK